MKLYIYHHCPFCLRALMVANYKDLPYRVEYLLNDDVETPTSLIGKKQVPILRLYDYSAMAESMEIARQLDELGDPDRIIRPAGDTRPVRDAMAKAAAAVDALVFPRTVAMDVPEFRSAAAIDYYQQKKEAALGFDFAQAMADSPHYQQQTEAMLASLPVPERPSAHDHTLSWDDVEIFPALRNLTMVRGLTFPSALLDYVHDVASLTKTDLYFNQAL